jgi:hypothetical protein
MTLAHSRCGRGETGRFRARHRGCCVAAACTPGLAAPGPAPRVPAPKPVPAKARRKWCTLESGRREGRRGRDGGESRCHHPTAS